MEKRVEKKIISTFVLVLLMVASIVTSFVSYTEDMSTPYIVKAGNNYEDCADNESAWHNETYLNVTIESKYPRILWYDIQKYDGSKTQDDNTAPADNNANNWTSIRNDMVEVDNSTWIRFVINISSDQGWDNIKYINITGWHDNGTSYADGTGYNTSDNEGSNRNFRLYYDNTSNTTANYNISWPTDGIELTKGSFTETNVTDNLGISSTQTKNLTFEFKPGYQFRFAPGPDGTGDTWTNYTVNNTEGFPESNDSSIIDYHTTSWEQICNDWSWDFNITVENFGARGNTTDGTNTYYDDGPFSSWVLDEFGTYTYTEIVSAESVDLQGTPGQRCSTNTTDPFVDPTSDNVTVRTRSNGNYSLTVNISDLYHDAYDLVSDTSVKDNLILENDTIFIRGGTRTTQQNFSDGSSRFYIDLYGSCDSTTGASTGFEEHEVNGTCKYTGEIADDSESNGEQYPNGYSSGDYGGHNSLSHYIEFNCDIPLDQWAGKYSTFVHYHLRTDTTPLTPNAE